ncbi:group IID secretory phospholipase A2-like [Peromyscus californicus insignis]|uniref:group IID secretory phospholipase A2-like n=1 Tax=Peromyscus californicus insignis TaxID=564181 RepID=UPI0022A7581E|nr:group IID secretory phospholipase A2-like [Peromyscus californicus insignis]
MGNARDFERVWVLLLLLLLTLFLLLLLPGVPMPPGLQASGRFPCLHLPSLCMTPTQGGLLDLNKMVRHMTGKIAFFNYWPYGCHCGLGGKGEPKDATDWCCQRHDCCYAHLKTDGCRIFTDTYKYSISQGNIQCCEYQGLRAKAAKAKS